jgi:hypothetical protein
MCKGSWDSFKSVKAYPLHMSRGNLMLAAERVEMHIAEAKRRAMRVTVFILYSYKSIII